MNSHHNISPPTWALRFFKWFCKPELQEYIEGDLQESFADHLEHLSPQRAKRKYVWEVLKLFRPGIIRHFHLPIYQPTTLTMLFNYLKIGFRQIKKHALFSFLNILGLATSMAICLLVLMMIVDQYAFDQFHEHKDRTYRIISDRGDADTPQSELRRFTATAPLAFAKELQESHPEVEEVVRIQQSYETELSIPDNVIIGKGLRTDPNFFKVFDFGNPEENNEQLLVNPNSLILTESFAKKLFGKNDPLGELVNIGTDDETNYIVTGIIPDHPDRTHIVFDYLTSFSIVESRQPEDLSDWENIWRYYVYLLLKDHSGAEEQLKASLEKTSLKRSELDRFYTYRFEAQSINDINPRDGRVEGNEIGATLPPMILYILGLLALLIILSACINYTNLSIARSLKRAKEIGIIKVIGGRRSHLIVQFLVESTLISLLALLIAILLLELLIPLFYGLNPFIQTVFHLKKTPFVYGIFVVFSLFVGFLAGIFPALHLSAYQPIQVLKSLKEVTLFSFFGLRKGLIVLQFTLCLLFITSTLLIIQQYQFVIQTDHGFNYEHVLHVDLQQQPYELFAEKARQISDIADVSGSKIKLASGTAHSLTAYIPDSPDSLYLHTNYVSHNFLENLDMQLLAGSNFPQKYTTSASSYIILNEMAVGKLNVGTPAEAIGKPIEVSVSSDSTALLTIIGVVENFYDMDVTSPVYPYMMRYDPSQLSYANIRFKTGATESLITQLKDIWQDIDPQRPLKFAFYDDEVYERYSFLDFGAKIIGLVSILAIIIACMGLLGMVIYFIEGRIKEIGIRKVLGASVESLILKLSRSFFILLGISAVIASPLVILLNGLWLASFPQRINIGPGIILLGCGFVFMLGMSIVISQTYRAARANPVEALKTE